jgi:hypothetical protein
MLIALRREYGQLVTSGTQLLLLLVGLQVHTRVGWLLVLALMAVISVFAWMSALRRLRVVRDTPTSKIASAAQGYVELIGRGKHLSDAPLRSWLTGLPCLWYRYEVAHKGSDNKWHIEEKGESEEPFIIDDGSGRCVVDPTHAEILTRYKDSWQKGDYRYTEWKLLDVDTIYAIGQFRTFGGSSAQLDSNEEVKNVLAEWKQNMPELHRRFDLNSDGKLDMQEWLLARQAARREAAKRMAAERAKPDVNYLLPPQDGRLFLISNLPQQKLTYRYWFWTWVHLAVFLGALFGVSWLLH